MYKYLGLMTLIGSILTCKVAWSIPAEVNLSIKRQQAENYEQFLQRAQNLASNTLQQRFRQGIQEMRVVVMGENKGAIAPILTVQVNRDNWNTEPSVKRWQNVFPYSKELLGFEQPPIRTTRVSETATPPPPPNERTDAPDKKPTPQPMISLPEPTQNNDTPPIPLPNQRLQPNRMK